MFRRALPALTILACSAPPAIGPLEAVVPGAALPAEVEVNRSNNNLDVIDHAGRLYLAFRTAPTHFASSQTRLYVVSTTDERVWRYEAVFALGTDLREPRFFSCGDRLRLYFARLGSDPTKFEPGQTLYSELGTGGTWTSTRSAFSAGFIPWRVTAHEGRPLLVGYTGGENIYDADGGELEVQLLTSDDCDTWKPLSPDGPVVYRGGASETSIAFDREGTLFAVARNEAGDSGGFGSKICTAPRDALSEWSCVDDKRKFDSPLLFEQGGELYLIARRHLSDSGNFDLEKDFLITDDAKRLAYLADYSLHPKRCTVWRLDREALTVEELKDLPSKGDTCFPSVVRRDDDQLRLYNYTSPVDQDGDPTWIEGQLAPTIIYATTLRF